MEAALSRWVGLVAIVSVTFLLVDFFAFQQGKSFPFRWNVLRLSQDGTIFDLRKLISPPTVDVISLWTSIGSDRLNEKSYVNISRNPSSACIWRPNDDGPCISLLYDQIQESLRDSGVPIQHRRWVFLGDSTMKSLFSGSSLAKVLFDVAPIRSLCPQYLCSSLEAGRCDMIDVLRLQRSERWIPPNYTMGEGPVVFGADHPFCQDCLGCDSAFLWCRNGVPDRPCQYTGTSRGLYGGYISVEFARDVEVQTSTVHNDGATTTSQQSIVEYLDHVWNTPAMVSDFGLPICVMGAGHHDIGIPNITSSLFWTNVEWYINLLSTQCDHIVWIGNNAPLTDDAIRSRNQTQEWNWGVRDRIISRRSTASYVDVFDASTNFTHKDNLHMNATWYQLLGEMFVQVVQHEP